jgi:hypothetical protein
MVVKGILCYVSTVASLAILLENVSATQIGNQTQISGAMVKTQLLTFYFTCYLGPPSVI